MSQQGESNRSRWGPVPSDADAAQALIAGSAKAEPEPSAIPSKQYRKRPRAEDGEHHQKGPSYYGPQDGSVQNEDEEPVEKKKANFGLSGALTKDTATASGGQVYKGVKLKFQEPPEARTPKMQWRFYVFKGEEQIDTLHVSKQSAYLFARDGSIADVHIQHPSCSSQHAVLQYRALPNKDGKMSCQPYLMDLESTNGSFINDVQIDSARYYQLKSGDVLKFGSSTREYVLLNADSKSG